MYFRQKIRRERIEAPMIPMPLVTSTNGCNNDVFDITTNYDNPAINAQTSANNAYSNSDCTMIMNFQQPPAAVDGAEGGHDCGDIECEDTGMYEALLHDKGQHCEV